MGHAKTSLHAAAPRPGGRPAAPGRYRPRSAIREKQLWLAAALFLAFLQGVVVGFVLAVKMLGVG